MATPAEKKALLFLGVVTLLGGSVRLWRSHVADRASESQTKSASPAEKQKSSSERASSKRTAKAPAKSRTKRSTARSIPKLPPPSAPVDLDVASVTDIEALGFLKAGIARMIVANRDSFGPFGSIKALSRITYLRKSTITDLAPFVTFSRVPRPTNAVIQIRSDTPSLTPKKPKSSRPRSVPKLSKSSRTAIPVPTPALASTHLVSTILSPVSSLQPFNLRTLLEEMVQRSASDLHIVANSCAKFRIHGEITNSRNTQVLTPKDTLQLAYSILNDPQKKRFELENELDFSFGLSDLARFRGNVFRQRGSISMAIRQIPLSVKTFDELGLPASIAKMAERPRGLVLVTGPTGSGKSTTLAAMLDKINREQKGHIITVEDPIEFIHRHHNCIVSQREIGADTKSFASALKYALREDPDVILVGEMRDHETIQAALTIAETGHLAFATLHTNSAAEAINRIIDVFPGHQQSQIRSQLAFVLEGIVTQTLVKKSHSEGRAMAAEILVTTQAIRALIRDNKVHQIYSSMQAGKKFGMQTLNDALHTLYTTREISLDECLRVSNDQNEFLRMAGINPEQVFVKTSLSGTSPSPLTGAKR